MITDTLCGLWYVAREACTWPTPIVCAPFVKHVQPGDSIPIHHYFWVDTFGNTGSGWMDSDALLDAVEKQLKALHEGYMRDLQQYMWGETS